MGVVVASLTVLFVAYPPIRLAVSYPRLKATLYRLAAVRRTHAFDEIPSDLARLSQIVKADDRALAWMGYLTWVPGFSERYRNLRALTRFAQAGIRAVQTFLPEAEKTFLVLSSQSQDAGRLTAMNVFLQSLPAWGSDLYRAEPDLNQASQALQRVDVQDLPGPLAAHALAIRKWQQILPALVANLPTLADWPRKLDTLLGYSSPQRYLLLFQNSGELRPTGGFLTAYSLVTVSHGQWGPVTAHNIYSLASVVRYRPPAPPILHDVYTRHWHIRDANLSPNLPTTVQYINRFYQSIPHAPAVNGMIFIDTWFVDNLLADVGPLTMPAAYHHVVITARNANYQMEYLAERSGLPSDTRKAFIGTMIHDLLKKVMTSRGTTLFRVIKTVGAALNHKLVLLYFTDPTAERWVLHHHWGGTLDRRVAGDYLAVVDANLGGHKDNYFMHYRVRSTITGFRGRYEQTVKITWINPAVIDHWLVVPYQAWVRLYVPLGSRLLSMTGVNGTTQDYNNFVVDKTVFGNHVTIPGRASLASPPATGSMTVRYLLPRHIRLTSLTIQLQPGIRREHETVIFGRFRKAFTLTHDVTVTL